MAGFFDLDEYFAKNKSNPYITGDYSAFLGSGQGPLGAKTDAQMKKINELFKASRDNGLTVMKLLKDMQGQYAQLGYDLAFSENGKGGTTISIVPSGLDWRSAKSTSGLQKMIRENYAAQGINDAKMLAQMSEALSFDISIPTTTSGLKKLFGQDAVDQVMLTTVGKGAKQQAAAITRTVHQLSEVLNKTLSNTQYKSYLRGMANSRASVDDRFKDAARARASLQKTIKDAISGTATTASYQNLNAESRRLQQAQGTALAKLVKQGQLNFDQLLRNTIQGDAAAFEKARGAMGKKGTAASDQDVMATIANEYSRILMMYAQNVAQTQIDSQIQAITEQSAILKALSGTQSLNFIKNIGKNVINSLGLSFGPSQENAFAMRSVSLVGNKDLSILGSLFSGGDRKPLQMGNTLDITKKAAKARQMVNSVQRKFYTDLQSKNIAEFKGNKLLRDMYRGAYAGEAEIRAIGKAFRQSMNDKQWKQYVKMHGGSERAALASIALGDSGLHSETAFISESLRDALESAQYRTLSLSAADWSKYMGRVPVGTNRAQVKSEAMYRAIMGELGIGRAAVVGKNGGGPQVKIDPEGNALISFSTLKPVGVGNTKLMFGDLTGKATVAGLLSPEFLKFFAAQRGLQEAPQFILEKGGINARNMAGIFSGHVAHMLETATPSEIKQLNKALGVNWFKEVGQVGRNGYYERATDIFEKSDAATMANFVNAWNRTFGGRSALSIENGKLTYDANKPILSSIGQYGGYSYGQTVGNEPNVKIDYRALGSVMNTLDLLNHKGIKTNDMRKFLLGNVEFDNHLKRWVPVKGSKPGLLYGGAEGWKDSERALAIAKEVRENAEWNTSDAAKTFDLDSFLKGQMVVASRRSADEFFKSVIGDRQLSEAEQQALGQLIKTNFVNVSGTDPFWRAKYENGGVTNFADLLVGKLYNAQAAAGDQLLSTIIDLSDAKGNGPESRYFRIPNFKNFGLERNGSSFNLPDNANVASIFKVIENIADGYAGNPGLAFNDFNNKLLETVDTKGGSIYQNLNPRIGHSFYGQVSVANVDKFLDENTSSFERHRLGAQVGASYDAASAQLEGYGLEELADLYRYVQDDLYTREAVDDKIGKICQKAENMVNDFHKKKGTLASEEEKNRAKIKALKGSLLASVTPGTNAYAERERVAASKGLEKLHNLPIFEFRNPLSHGHDLYNTELYVDRELGVKGSAGKNNGNVNYALRPGLGLQIAFNADADGDQTGTIMFAPGGGVAKSFKESADLYDAWLMRNAALNARDIQSDQSGKDYTQDLKDLMLNPETQEAVGVLTRLNKGYTGTFSNIFQAVNEALHQTAGSGTGAAPLTPEDYLTLNFFESAVQDAISAKKVIERIQKGGNPLDAVQGAFTDQETLVKLLKETDYGDAASRERLFNHMTAMGILGTDDKSAFSSRISNLTYSQFYTMFADENGQLSEENAARLAGLFGVRPEELVRFGKDSRIISGDKVKARITRAALEQAIQNTQERLVKGGFRGGIGGSIRSRFSIVPGLRIYNNQHAGWSTRYRNQHLGGPNTPGAGGNFYSISRLLATAFNEVYPDTSAVEKGILDLMATNPGYDYPEFYSKFGVTAADLAMSDEQFNEAKSGYLTPLGGKIADAAQQIIAQAQNDLERAFGDSDLKEKLRGAGWGLEDKIKNVYQAQKLYSTLAGAEGNELARRMVLRYGSSMISPGHGYGNIEGSEGLAFLLGSEMISPEILSMLESEGGYEEYLQGFGEEGTGNAAILRGFLGGDADIWKAQQLANGAILNNMLSKYGTIGATELPLQYFDNNNNPHSGRADALVYTTDAEGRKGITVFDKKISKKITPHHMLQSLAYVRALEHAQEVIKKMGYKSYDEMANGNFASDSGLKKTFEYFYGQDPEAARTLFTELLEAQFFSGGITRVHPTTGEFELATLPFSDKGIMSLTGSREEDDRLLAALASNSNIEAWSEADRGLLNKVRLRTVGTGVGATPMGVSEYQNYRQQRAEAYKEYLTHLGVSEDESLPQDIRDMHAQMAEAIDTSIIRSLEMRMAQLRALFADEENGLSPEARRRAIAQMEEADEKYTKKETQDTANAAYDSKIAGAKTAMSLREEGVRAYLNVLKAEKALADARNEAANAGKGQSAQLLAGNKVYMAEQNLAAAIGIRDKYATQHPEEAGLSAQLANAMYGEAGSSGGGAVRGQIAQHGLIGGGMSAIGGLFSRLIRSYGLYAIMGVLRKTFSSFINTAKALDQTMVNLRIVTNGTKEETQELISQYTNLGKNIGASTQEVAASALEWQRQGYEAGEIIDLVTSSIYLSKLGMIEASEATKDLTSALKGFKMSATESMDIVDKLTAIDLKAATSAGEIAEGLAQFANIGSLMGVNIDQAASYVATIADVTQMSGSSAGQAMKMIISRYGNVKAGAFSRSNLDASAENGEAINDVERVLNKLGITMRKSHSQFKDFDETLEEIAGKWSTLDNISQKAIATAFAGVRQQEAFVTLMQNWDKYQELLTVSETSKGTAARKYEAYQEGLAAATKRLATTVEDLINKQQVGGLLTSLVDVLTNIGEKWLPNLVKYIPQLIFLIQDIRAFRGTSWLNRLGDKVGGVSGVGKLLFGESTEQSRILFHRKQETAEVAKQVKLEQEKTQEEIKQNAAEKNPTAQDITQNAAGKTGGGGVSKFSAAMSGLTIPLMSLAGWFMGKSTANRSHTNRLGETVTSSKYAAARGSSVEAAWSALPFIGTLIGSAVSDSLMAEIDKIYDEVRITTEKAQKAVTVLTKIGSSVSSLSGLANSLGYEDMIEANRIADEMLAELYSAEGEESRRTIEKYLPSVGRQLRSMSSLLEEFKNESYEGRKQIVDDLESAQLKAQHEQERLAQEQEKFEQEQSYQESLRESLGNVEQYAEALGLTFGQNLSATGSGLFAGLPMTASFAGGGALGGALLGTKVGTLGGPVGALIGALAGALIGGIVSWFTSGKDVRESVKDSYLAENAAAFASARTPKDLIEELQKLEKELIEHIDENGSNVSDEDYEDLANVRKAIEATREYQNYLFKEAQIDDRRIAKEALLETIGSSGDTIRNMSLGQLKRMGITQVYEAFAKQVMKNGGLSTISPFANGTVTQDFINMVTSMLREDPELDLLLSGYAYTVKEASELSRSDLFDERVMQQFAMALHITVDELGQIAEIIPDLKLADLLKSTAELEESVDNYQKLFSSLRSGTSETSKWMTEITNQFPELVAYMDDIPTLMGKIISRMKQLNQVVILQQFDELKSSPEAFQERFLPDILAYVLQNAGRDMLVQVQELIDRETITSAADVQRYLASNPQDEVSQWLEKAARNMGSDYDLAADLLKPEWKQYTTYIADLWKKQLENLEAQKNMLSEMSKQREYEINLLKAQLKLQETMNEKQRIYRAGVGWVYEADQGKIQEAKKELEDLEVTKQISEITKQINEVQYMVTKWESIWEIREKERVEEEVKAFMKAMGIENEEGIFGGKYSTALQSVFGLDESTSFSSLLSSIVFNTTVSGIEGLPSAFAEEMRKILDKDKEDRSEAMTRIDALDKKLRWADANPNQIGAGEYNTWLSEYTNAVKDAKSRGFISSAEYDDYIARYDRKDVSNPAYKVSQAYAQGQVSTEAQGRLDFYAQRSASGFSNEAEPLQISQAEDGSYYISFKEQSNSDLKSRGYTKSSALRTNSNGELIFDTGKRDERSLILPESSLKLISVGRTKDGGASYLYQYDPLSEVLSSDEIGQILLSTSVAASPLYDTITASEFRSKFAESRIFFNNNGEGTILPATSNNLPKWLQFSPKDSGFQSYFTNRASNEDFFIEVDGAWYFISRGKAYLAKTARDMAAFAYMQGDSWLLGDPNGEANYSKLLGSGALGIGALSGALAATGIASNASGGYLPVSTRSFVNELGTEAIVTPQGTITSLPGHTGIVPADITANLWALGEVAPNLLRAFGDTIMSRSGLIPASASTDESFNIGNLTMNVSADKSFDAEAFVQSIKDRVALTKNTRR